MQVLANTIVIARPRPQPLLRDPCYAKTGPVCTHTLLGYGVGVISRYIQ